MKKLINLLAKITETFEKNITKIIAAYFIIGIILSLTACTDIKLPELPEKEANEIAEENETKADENVTESGNVREEDKSEKRNLIKTEEETASEIETEINGVNLTENISEKTETDESAKHEHIWEYSRTVREPSCDIPGIIIETCACGADRETETPATGHQYGTDQKCIKCGQYKNHVHDFDYAVIDSPTCVKNGTGKYTCRTCGSSYTESIKTVAHQYNDGKCITCGCSQKKELEENISVEEQEHRHIWDKGKTVKEQTCTEDGIIKYTCTDCGETYTETIPAKGHAYGTGSEECTRCGVKTHDHNDMSVFDEICIQQETCLQYGYYQTKCRYCGYVLKEDRIGKEHKYDTDGKCIYCGQEDGNEFTRYGRSLKASGMSEYDMMISIAQYVVANGYGECTGYSACAAYAAEGAGIGYEYRSVGEVRCQGTGEYHKTEDFNEYGYCNNCGLGDNHHWIRFYLSDGNWYEFDLWAGDMQCYSGPNASRYGTT